MPMSSMPSRGAAPADDEEDSSSLVPASGGDEAAGGSDQEEARTGAIKMVHQLTSQIEAIAKQFPEFAKAGSAASKALVEGAVAMAGNKRGPGKAGSPPMQ
jgi:hypothetical protein